jgi:hypothetical protein
MQLASERIRNSADSFAVIAAGLAAARFLPSTAPSSA